MPQSYTREIETYISEKGEATREFAFNIKVIGIF